MLRKLEYKPMCLYLDWLEDRLFAEFNYSCVDSLADFNHLQEKAVTKEGLIKARGGKHEKDDRPEIRGKEHYVLGWDNKEKIAVLQAEVRQLQQEEKMTAAKVRKLEEDIKNAQKKRETYLTLFSKYDKFDDIDWQSCVLVIQQKQEQKRQLEEANNRVKILQEQLAGVRKEIGLLDDENNEAIKKKTLSENRENKLKERRNESNSALAQIGVVDTDTFESQHTDLLNVALEDLNGKRDTLQHEIDLALQKQRETKSRKNSDLKNLIYRFKNPAEEITMKYHDWRSDVSRLPEAVEFMGEYQAYYQRLLDEDIVNLLTSESGRQFLENPAGYTSQKRIVVCFIKAIPEAQGLFSYYSPSRNPDTPIGNFLFCFQNLFQYIVIGNFFLCPLVRICQRRSNHESGFLVDNPVTIGKMVCQRIMQLVT